ncbi:RNA pyrophosphohydrolase [Helicobacter cappadocius]|uniref:RNA pyrophosphohydrolase n=1 Tax=Helicobacter cappadocius TaxID=3063998 RepID=A0AA90PLK2_9HELI|nr:MULTISPECIES: RNA pyrophosphohydrolase [unclassified Helicobacter]MDO7253672.1 RNA pyrophosphohydrolase [Helicobacter sp. faydin-H75]MDP2539640.1 RNA pyrophosphohydrolase [Helicobacter sp. faydin-H76]
MQIKKSYRPNVAAVVLSSNYPSKCEFFVAQRSDIKGAWQFPQGGIDQGETPLCALFRELKEEIGTDEVEVIAEFPTWIRYDFPSSISKKFYPFDGQEQKYFLVRLKNDSNINIQTDIPEFDRYEFVGYDELFEKITHFKKQVYKQVIDYFRKEGYL